MPALRHNKPIIGILLMVSAMQVVPVMDAIAKVLSDEYPVLQIVWARFFFHFLIVMPVVLYRYGPTGMRTDRPWLQTGRGLFLLVATITFFGAISYMPIADALAIVFFDAPIVVILSAVFLKERVSKDRWISIAIAFAGILIIVRPGFETFHWASVMAFATGVSFALYLFTTRMLSGSAPPLVTLAYQSLGGVVVMSLWVPFVWIDPSLKDLLLMITLGAVAALGHLLLIKAFDYAEASLLAPFSYTEMIMATLIGLAIFGDFPDAYTWVGMVMIIGVGVYLSLSRTNRPDPA